MSNKDPIISILIPAYNHENYIEETIISIWEQELSCCEIIVLDDGSKDSTYIKAKRLAAISPIEMKVLTRENRGLSRTLNELIRLSKAKYLYFIASDDKLAPRALRHLYEEFLFNPNLKIIYANGKYFYGEEDFRESLYSGKLLAILESTKNDVLRYLYSNISNILTQTSVIERNFLIEIGGFDESALLDDWPYHIKIFENLNNDNEWKFLNIEFLYYRRHANNMSRDIEKQFMQITDTVNRFVPDEYAHSILADAYFNLAMIALLKFRFMGVKLLYLSQMQELNIKKILFVPLILSKNIFKAIAARFLK